MAKKSEHKKKHYYNKFNKNFKCCPHQKRKYMTKNLKNGWQWKDPHITWYSEHWTCILCFSHQISDLRTFCASLEQSHLFLVVSFSPRKSACLRLLQCSPHVMTHFNLCPLDWRMLLFLFFSHIFSLVLLQFSRSVMSDSATPWTAARRASLSITNSWSLLKLKSIESVMPSNHLILCCPLLFYFLPNIYPLLLIFLKPKFFLLMHKHKPVIISLI